jgi:hypothetical protein
VIPLHPHPALLLGLALLLAPACAAYAAGAWDEAMFDDPATRPGGDAPPRKHDHEDEKNVPPSRVISSAPLGARPQARVATSKRRATPQAKPARPPRPFDAMSWLEDTLAREESRPLPPLRTRRAPAPEPAPEADREPATSHPGYRPSAPEVYAPPPAAPPPPAEPPPLRAPSPRDALERARAIRLRSLPGSSGDFVPPPGYVPPPDPQAPAPAPDTPVRERPRIHRDAFLPSLSGALGLVDVPVAFTPEKGAIVATYQKDHVRAHEGYWPGLYRTVNAATHAFGITHGLRDRWEIHGSLEVADRDVHYRDLVLRTDPLFSGADKVYPGAGVKYARPLGRWFDTAFTAAVGVRWQHLPGSDRSFTEIHEYERTRNAYAVVSARASDALYLHTMLRQVIYDSEGTPARSGRTARFPGYAPDSSWTQGGLAAEYLATRNLSVFAEGTMERGVEFGGGMKRHAVNAGVRWQEKTWGVGVYGKRLDHSGLEYYGVQGAVRL